MNTLSNTDTTITNVFTYMDLEHGNNLCDEYFLIISIVTHNYE